MDKVAKDLTFVPYSIRVLNGGNNNWWTGPKSNRTGSRLRVVEHLKKARVPVLKMVDTKTNIEFDLTSGSSSVNKRHIELCKAIAVKYPSHPTLTLSLKSFL